MFLLIRFNKLLLLLLTGLLGASSLVACNSGSGTGTGEAAGSTTKATAPKVELGPQPVLDSTYVMKTFEADARFKDQLKWAKLFYEDREYQLGWFKDHRLRPQAERLLGIIAKAKEEGLEGRDYRVSQVKELIAKLQQAREDSAAFKRLERETDVAMTGTYLTWASDYYRGLANPRDVKGMKWDVKRNKIKLHKALSTFLGERESRYDYYEFAPLHPEYDYLKKALAAYRAQEAAGGWKPLPDNLKLRPGDSSPAVPALRQRLLGGAGSPGNAGENAQATTAPAVPVAAQTGPGTTTSAAPPADQIYSPDLVEAVKNFQADAGLRADGIVGGNTLAQLNVPIGERIDQLVLNMERWRWLPKRFEEDYLLVNIPEYKLHVIEDGKEAMNMRVIVGKTLNATPVFSDKLEYVVLAPYWNVPFSIIDKELRPKLVANPYYLNRLDMEVVKGWGAKATPVDPASINWAGVTEDNFKYTLRRRPGPKNDLGDVKFIFPNSDNVYLHDTPRDELFSQTQRNFSHGCVRVEEPIKLATYLLRNKPNWDRATIQDTIARRREKYITLAEKLPVYLVYFTAWADADGHPHFREDIYGHDKTLAKEYFN